MNPRQIRFNMRYIRRMTSDLREAWFYARVSLDRNGELLAVSRQWDDCEPLQTPLGLRVTRRFEDNSISATSGALRPAFEELLAALATIPSPKPVILVWHVDRLVRVTADLERVIATDTNVYAKHAGHIDLSTPAGRAVARTVVAWATYEGEIRTERQRTKFIQLAAQGKPWWSIRPFGFEYDGSHREDEMMALRAVYARVLAQTPGDTLTKMCRSLEEANLPPTMWHPPLKVRWNITSLKTLLRAPRNAGLREHNGKIVGQATWEPVLPREQWEAAVEILNNPSRKLHAKKTQDGQPRLLSGIAQCVVCQQKVKSTGQKANRPWGGYTCPVGHVVWQRPWLDNYILRASELILGDPALRARWLGGADNAARRETLFGERDLLTARLDEIAEERALGLMTRDQMVKANDTVNKRVAEINAELETLINQANVKDLEDLLNRFEAVRELPVEKAKQMVRSLFVKVELCQQKRGRGKPSGKNVNLWITDDAGKLITLPTLENPEEAILGSTDSEKYWVNTVMGMVRGVDYDVE